MIETRQSPRLVVALAVTQTIGWGTTYYLPSVLAPVLGQELGFSPFLVFAAVTVMLVVSAVISPAVGRYLDIHRSGPAMACGSVALAIGLVLVAFVREPMLYLTGWAIIGAGSASALTLGAHISVVQNYGHDARHFLTLLMLTGGISVGLFWPLTQWLLQQMSWRNVVLLYATIHLVVCAPLHWAMIGRGKIFSNLQRPEPMTPEMEDSALSSIDGVMSAKPQLAAKDHHTGVFLIVVAFAAAGFVSWGLPLHYATLFSEAGIAVSLAVAIGAMTGPSQIVARLMQWLVFDRVARLIQIVLAASIVIVLIMLAATVLPFTYMSAVAFTLIFGFASGIISMARATLPLVLFGAGGFGTLLGRMMQPFNFAFAASPMIYAYLIQNWGTSSVKWLSLVVVLLSAWAFWSLSRLVDRSHPTDQ
jgi:hypothetical protein